MVPNLTIRPRTPADDDALVYASWLNSFEPYRDHRATRDLYYQEHHTLVERVLRGSQTLVACNGEDLFQIFGWLCYADTSLGRVLHYAYVKPAFRRMGIARALFAECGPEPFAAFSHMTDSVGALKAHGLLTPGAVFDPYLPYHA